MSKFEKLHKNNQDLFSAQRQNKPQKQKRFSDRYSFIHYFGFAQL